MKNSQAKTQCLTMVETSKVNTSALLHQGWSFSRAGEEVRVCAPDADPGAACISNKGSLPQRLLFALVNDVLGDRDEVAIQRLDVADLVKALCVNGDLPGEFIQVADWIAAGSLPCHLSIGGDAEYV
jgi:hypothetical protein